MIEGLPHVYSARCLVPAGNSGIKVLVLNANQESQVLTEGTKLDEVQGVYPVDCFRGTSDRGLCDVRIDRRIERSLEKDHENASVRLNR